MFLPKINYRESVPVYRQIAQQIKESIENDLIKPGSVLPPTRVLAEKLGLNRSTVFNAYQELWSLGYIESRQGSYSKVRQRFKIATDRNKLSTGIIDWDKTSSEAGKITYKSFPFYKSEKPAALKSKDAVDFSRFTLDRRLYPVKSFRRSINNVLTDSNSKILNYIEFEGYYPLREFIAERLRLHNINTSPEEIAITNGSQNGIELVTKLLTNRNDNVIVEAPTYSMILPLFKSYGLNIIEIPMKNDGMDNDTLEKVLKQKKISLIYTMPNFHNPTGITTSQSHRERLLSLSEKYRVPILEDGFEEEMKYYGKIVLPIKSMDKKHTVIYAGTFSKVLFPGIRLGWIAAERKCIERIIALKRFGDLCSNSIIQAAMNDFCRKGLYDLHIKKMQRIYSNRMNAAIKCIKKYVPRDEVERTEPNGGYIIWFRIKQAKDRYENYREIFTKHKVVVSNGNIYFIKKPGYLCFRLCISTLNEDEIERGIHNLGKALQEILELKKGKTK